MKVLVLTISMLTNVWADLPDEDRQRQLLNMLKHDCGSCHGLLLTGGLGPSLTADALAGREDSELVQIILNGRAGTPMPPWRDFISRPEAFWLVGNLRRNLPR